MEYLHDQKGKYMRETLHSVRYGVHDLLIC